MTKRSIFNLPKTLTISFTCLATATQAATFTDLGDLPGGQDISEARAISADGSSVVGMSLTSTGTSAFRWTQSEGIVELPHWYTMTSGNHSEAEAISADGSTIVGKSTIPGRFLPITWYADTLQLDVYPTNASDWVITAVSANGEFNLVRGCISFSSCFTSRGDSNAMVQFGLSPNGNYNYAYPVDISDDGNFALVSGQHAGQAWFSYIYDFNASGYTFVGSTEADSYTYAKAMNSDASLVVGGRKLSPSGSTTAFIWQQDIDTFTDLGTLPGHSSSDAIAISENGEIVVGNSGPLSTQTGFIWTPGDGMRELQEYLLTEHQLDLGNFVITTVSDMTPDGSSIVGWGTTESGATHGFVVNISDNSGGLDSDADGMPDSWELEHGLDPMFPDDASGDNDWDMLTNLDEFLNGTDPNNFDSDNDELLDGDEIQMGSDPLNPDSDSDQLPDGWEFLNQLNPLDPNDANMDIDGDSLTALQEYSAGTNPTMLDTDGDTLDDGHELSINTNPLVADTDYDGIADNEELDLSISPITRDSDGDGLIDGFQYGDTVKASVPSNGNLPNSADRSGAAISADGRFIAFTSDSSEFSLLDDNNDYDVFVHDIITGITEQVSVANDGSGANNWSGRRVNSINLDISADGRYVVFSSGATNLDPACTSSTHVYLRDRQLNTTECISLNENGSAVSGTSWHPSISDDGQLIAYESSGALIGEDDNGKNDIYVYDRSNTSLTLVSVATDGTLGNNYSKQPAISANGAFVTFLSEADNLVENDTNGLESSYYGRDIFVHELATATTKRINLGPNGEQADHYSSDPSISGDGRYIAFASYASNLSPLDNNGSQSDVFVYDQENASLSLISLNLDNTASGDSNSWGSAISDDGRYVVFGSHATDLVENDNARRVDVFIRDLVNQSTNRVSINDEGEEASGDSGRYGFAISADNQFIAYQSSAGNLSPGAHTGSSIYVKESMLHANIDLAISGPTSVQLSNGEAVSYTVTNVSDVSIPASQLTFSISAGSVVNIISEQAECDLSALPVTCELNILTPGASATIEVFPELSASSATITASVNTSGNDTDLSNNSLSTDIETANSVPTVSVTAPLNGSTFNDNETVLLQATASDAEDGDLSSNITWFSNIDGELGTGASISITLSIGVHSIEARVSDEAGQPAQDTVNVTVAANSAPTVNLTAPLNGSTYTDNESVLLQATASDAEDGDISSNIVWFSNIDGELGTGASISVSLSVGLHTIEARVSDSGALPSQDSVNVTVDAYVPQPVNYCDSQGQNTNYEWIDAISVNGSVNQSGSNSGHADYTHVQFALNKGSSASISLEPGFRWGSYTEHWKVWIDLNQDGNFDTDEQLYSGSSRSNIYSNIVIPSTALSGQTRMRISMRYGSAPSACGTFYYGEVEDYSVVIQ